MTKEQQILHYMKSLQISRAEAEQLWEDDKEDFIGEEGEEMTQKAKQVKRYEQADKSKEKPKKERKVDETKALILGKLHKTLETFVKITNVKTETEISFVYNDEEYTLKLTKHRPKKQSIGRLHKCATCFLFILPIDKSAEMCYNWARRWRRAPPALYYTIPFGILSIGNLHKNLMLQLPKFVLDN